MDRSLRLSISCFLLWLPSLCAQKSRDWQRIPMPADRASDSYRIYSGLLPSGETESKGRQHQAHELWLVEDTTITAVPPEEPCWRPPERGASAGFDTTSNPHSALFPPKDRKQDFDEILRDFDYHCHERLALDL